MRLAGDEVVGCRPDGRAAGQAEDVREFVVARREQLLDAVREVMESVLEADRKPDGVLRQDNVMRYVLAIKP